MSRSRKTVVRYLKSVSISLHQRGIKAILLAGCLLGFGLGQALGASYGPHANHAFRAPAGLSEASAAKNRASGGLGNSVAVHHQAAGTSAHASVTTPNTQTQTQSLSLTAPAPQPAATSPASWGKDHAKHDGKGHQKDSNGDNGKGNGKGDQKSQGHHKGNDGGPTPNTGNGGSGANGNGQNPSSGNGGDTGVNVSVSVPVAP